MQVITQNNSPNHTIASQVPAIYGMSRTIDYITIHWWGDPNANPTFEGVVGWLCNPRSGVSAHDVITGTGRRVAVLVDYPNAAWHAGNATGNAKSLGFELDPRARQEDYETAAEDIAETWKYYGRIIPLRAHKSWVATACPGSYDLNRLHNMALSIYNGAPAKRAATSDEIKQIYREILEREVDASGLGAYINSGMSVEEVRNALFGSEERKALEKKKADEAARPEWLKNLQDIQDVKLYVLPAEGVRVLNLQTLRPVNSTIIPRKTSVDIVQETKIGGVRYLISSYASGKGLPWGIRADGLGQLPVEPIEEKPEWLKNLQDIQDKDMWARSETPVLNITNGSVVRYLNINDKIRVTHATTIVDKPLIVLEGQKEVIETIYLSDSEIKNPYNDLEKRVTGLEAALKKIIEFFTSLGRK